MDFNIFKRAVAAQFAVLVKENCRWATMSTQARNKQRKDKPKIGVRQGASGNCYSKLETLSEEVFT